MLKLIKYEFMKQKTSKFILAGFLLFGEILCLLGVVSLNEFFLTSGTIVLLLTSVAGFIVIALEVIVTYYQDMNDKRGYMLFMIPRNIFQIIGSKMLTGILTTILFTALIISIVFIDILAIGIRHGELIGLLQDAIYVLKEIISIPFFVDLGWGSFIAVMLNIVLQWCSMVTSAFFAITLSMTFLSRWKVKGLVSFVLYIVLNIIPVRLISLIQNAVGINEVYTTSNHTGMGIDMIVNIPNMSALAVSFIVTLVFGVICLLGTAQLLNKKLAL